MATASIHNTPSGQQEGNRLSWPATLAALIAFVTLLLTNQYSVYGGPQSFAAGSKSVLLLLMAVLLALRFSAVRLPVASWAHWAVRLPLYAAVFLLNWDKLHDPSAWLFDTSTVPAFGMIAAAELVIQAARGLPPGETNGSAICLLSGFVFLTACTTEQVMLIRIASPLYFACAVLSLPRFERAVPRREEGLSLRRRGVAILAALALGAAIYTSFYTFRTQLMQLGAGALHDRQAIEGTGISQQPTLEPTFGLRGSFQRVLRLEGDGGQAYLRGAAFDTYEGGRWGPSLTAQHFQPVPAAVLHAPASSAALHVTPLANMRGILFVPLAATGLGLSPDEDEAIQYDRGRSIFRVGSGTPAPYTLAFGGSSAAAFGRSVLSPAQRRMDLTVADTIDPDVRRLAQRITQGCTTPTEKAAAIQDFFFTHYQYSLTFNPGLGDPISNFLLKGKAAHCEFFASGAVILLRCVGIPARYVTGYYAHESEGAGVTVVRQQDSHAWAEAWLSSSGWTTLDATPAAGRPSQTAEDVSSARRAMEWMGDKVAALRTWVGQFTTGQILGALAGCVGLYLGLKQLWRWWRRRALMKTAGFTYAHLAELETLARRFEAWLARSGMPCPPSVPWLEHVRAGGLDAAQLFVIHYNNARFGKRYDPDTLSALDQELRQLETQPLPSPAEAAAA